jgi:peptide/nickel transport system substrate-binding protein
MSRGKRIRAWGLGLTLGAVVVLALPTGALGQSSASPSAQKVVFIEGTMSDIKAPNPLSPNALSGEYSVFELNYDLLLNFDKTTLAPAPGLADTWSQSDDGLTWTFHIRDGATWQDGQPLTAHDVAFTYSFIVENQIGTLSSYFPFSTGDSFKAQDDSTFTWTTSKPTTAPIYPAWVYIIPQHIFGDMTSKEAQKFDNFPSIGSGPFELTKWDKGQSWTMEANKNYWNGAPVIDEYIYKLYKNPQAMVEALKTGEIDYTWDMGADLFDSLSGVEGVTTHAGVPPGFSNLILNTRGDFNAPGGGPAGTGHPALLDERVRTAIAMSINKQDLVDRVLRGHGEPGTSIVPPRSIEWHWSPTGDEVIPFDIAGANKILDDAGYVDTNNDGVREMPGGGQPLDMRLDIENEDSSRIRAGRYIAGYLQQIGIKVTPQSDSYPKTLDFWYANDFDMYMWGWTPDPDPGFILSTFTTSQCQVWSDTCWSDPQYDQLYKAQQTAKTTDERKAILTQMQQIVYEKNPEIVTYYDQFLEAYRSDRWTGFQISPDPDGYLLEQYTPYSVLTLHPISGSSASSSGVPTWVWIAVVLGVVAVIGVVTVVRRRAPDEERA